MVNHKSGPLSGIRVVELTLGGVGPGAAKILADFGADVIKVESRDRPDGMRELDPEKWEKQQYFAHFNRNKKGIDINLKLPESQDILHKLISISDVFIENYAPGVTKRLGADYDTLVKFNPTLVMVSLSGLGQDGPSSNLLIWGPLLQAYTGVTNLWNHPYIDGMVGSQSWHPDFFAALFGGYLALGGIYQRALTGKGAYIDAPESEIGAALSGGLYLEYLINKREPQPQGNKSSYMSPHNIYRCAGEDKWIAIVARDDKDWDNLIKALGNPSWAKDELFSTLEYRLENGDELDSLIEEWTQTKSQQDILKILRDSEVPVGILMDPKDLLEDEHLNERSFWVSMEGHPHLSDVKFEGQPIGLSRTPWKYRLPAPIMGGYNEHVLGDLLGNTSD